MDHISDDIKGEITSQIEAQRADYYRRLAPGNYKALWNVLGDLVTPTPRPTLVPHLWHYTEARAYLMEAGSLITAMEAERRALILENPACPGEARITDTLFAALQLILPGEVAPAHRHSQSALRFVIEGAGAYTSVDGEKTLMCPGDFVITPSWTWHDHGNETSEPMVWLDGLDIPIIHFMNASFAERLGEDKQVLTRPTGDALARYGSGLMPVDHEPGASLASPVFNYPYDRTREALEALKKGEAWDGCHGIKLKYVNPATGGAAMATISTHIQLLPKGFETAPYRASDGTVFICVEGEGHSIIDGKRFDWGEHDIFILPPWVHVTHHAGAMDAVLFSYSDRIIQQKLGLWREERGDKV